MTGALPRRRTRVRCFTAKGNKPATHRTKKTPIAPTKTCGLESANVIPTASTVAAIPTAAAKNNRARVYSEGPRSVPAPSYVMAPKRIPGSTTQIVLIGAGRLGIATSPMTHNNTAASVSHRRCTTQPRMMPTPPRLTLQGIEALRASSRLLGPQPRVTRGSREGSQQVPESAKKEFNFGRGFRNANQPLTIVGTRIRLTR